MTTDLENKINNHLKLIMEERKILSGKYQFIRYVSDESFVTEEFFNQNLEKYVKYYVQLYTSQPFHLLKEEFRLTLEKKFHEPAMDEDDKEKKERENSFNIKKILVDAILILVSSFVVVGVINYDTLTRLISVGGVFIILYIGYFIFDLMIGSELSRRVTRPVLQETKMSSVVSLNHVFYNRRKGKCN